MTEVRFGCGEYVPGTRTISGPRIKPPPTPNYIPTDPFGLPGPPGRRIPKVPVDNWACICPGTRDELGGCSIDGGNRQCLPTSQIGNVPKTRSFFSKDECERVGFGEAPCSRAVYQCVEQFEQCPYPSTQIRALRTCFGILARDKFGPYIFDKLGACQAACKDEQCDEDRLPPVVPGDPGGGGGGRTTSNPTTSSVPGPSTPTEWWGCVEVSSYCPDGETVRKVEWKCQSILINSFPPPPPYSYRSAQSCRRYCAVSPTYYPCLEDTQTIYERPGTIPPNEPIDPITPNLEDITATLINDVDLFESRNIPSFTETSIIDVNDFANSTYIDNNTSSQGGVYHKVYNIFDYEDFPTRDGGFTSNYHNLEVFADYIPEEVAYMLENKNSNIEWEERYTLGLNKAKIIKSLNGRLYQAFKTIVDIDQQEISIDHFLGLIKRHLLNGTIDEFNPDYYINLAEDHRKYAKITLKLSDEQEINRRAALGFLASFVRPADSKKFGDPQKVIELNRTKFLPTDIEAATIVETVAQETFTVPLEDAGIAVSSVSAVADYVPLGEGGGYYFVLETVDGEEIPLELDTAITKAYYADSATRKLALTLLGEDHYTRLTVGSTFDKSELGSEYKTTNTVSAIYFKLDLTNITQGETSESIVETVRANYIKLTDPIEIEKHSKTYGGKVSQVNVQYDDPFIQYADISGEMSLEQKDVTFRQVNPRRSSGDYSILTRSIPDGLIIYPVKETKDNPLFAYSTMDTVSDSRVTRTLTIRPHFGLSEEEQSSPILTQSLIYEKDKTYKLGLLEDADTQNVYYTFEKSKFPNVFTVNGRSPIGHMFYNILEDKLSIKYTFDYLTWWDIFRRMKINEFTSFIYSVPVRLMKQLESGFKGYTVKSVLDRDGAISSVLKLKEGQQEDSVILTDRIRNASRS